MDAETGKIINGDIQAHTVSIRFLHMKQNPAASTSSTDISFLLSINASKT